MDEHNCAVCEKLAQHSCGKCLVVRYCSREHQKEHWSQHKNHCRPCRIETNDEVGRCLVASKNIEAGQIIFQDSPLLVAPKQVTVPVCLGCFRPVNGSYICPKCGWPMCSEECSGNEIHQPECEMTSRNRRKITVRYFDTINPQYECIGAIRCLWLKNSEPEKWKALQRMQSHEQDRINTQKYKLNQINVVDFIHKFMCIDEFSDADIHRVLGIMDVNGFELPVTGAVGLFSFGCLLEHACTPNTARAFDLNGWLKVRAATDIKKGDHITTSYVDPLWGVHDRKNFLQDSKYFDCNCRRCKDCTENDTHLSSLKCQSCKIGLVPPPLKPNEERKCDHCMEKISPDRVMKILEKFGQQLVALQGHINASEKFLRMSEGSLAENHHFRAEVKVALAQIYGRRDHGKGKHKGMDEEDGLSKLSKDELQRKLDLCRESLHLIEHLSPGLSCLRGILLYELQSSLQEQWNRSRLRRKKVKESNKQLIQEISSCLRECISILDFESPLQVEFQMCLQAKEEIKQIEKLQLRL